MAQWPEHGAYPWRTLHPTTQGKIERWHQTLKNRILLENYYLPGDLEAQIEAFVADYNHLRYHEGIGNLTPADVYFGRGQTILIEREGIKRIANRRLLHQQHAAEHCTPDEPETLLISAAACPKNSDDGQANCR
jgi:putative transposase